MDILWVIVSIYNNLFNQFSIHFLEFLLVQTTLQWKTLYIFFKSGLILNKK